MDWILLVLGLVAAPAMWWSGYSGYRSRGMTSRMRLWLAIAGVSGLVLILASFALVIADTDGVLRVLLRLTSTASMALILYWFLLGTRHSPGPSSSRRQ